MERENIFSRTFGILSKAIKTPFLYLYKNLYETTGQKKEIVEDFKKYSSVFQATNSNDVNSKFGGEKIVKENQNFKIFLMSVVAYIYLQQRLATAGENNKLKVLTNNSSPDTIDLLNKGKQRQLINESTKNFQIAMDKARKNGFSEQACDEIDKYLQQGIDVNSCDCLGRTPLHNMLEILGKNSKKFDLQRFRKLVNGTNVNTKDNNGVAPLWVVLSIKFQPNRKNRIEKIENSALDLVINAGANVNEKNAEGDVPLAWAIAENDLEVIKKLCAAGANLSEINKFGEDAIFAMLKATPHQSSENRILGLRTLMTHPKFDNMQGERFKALLSNLEQQGIPSEIGCLILSYSPECYFSDTKISALLKENFEEFSRINQTNNQIKKLNEMLKNGKKKFLYTAYLPSPIKNSAHPDFESVNELYSLVLDRNRLDRDFSEFQKEYLGDPDEFIKNSESSASGNIAYGIHNNFLRKNLSFKVPEN